MANRIVFLIFFLVALGLGGAAYYTGQNTREFLADAREVPGQIVAEEQSTDSEGDASYSPVYSYQVDGEQYRHTSSVSSSSHPNIGETVTILVDPADPTEARADTFMELWFLPVLFGGLAVVFLFTAFIGQVLRRKHYGSGGSSGDVIGTHAVDDHGSHPSANEATAMTTESIMADVSPARDVDLSGPFVTGNEPDQRGPFM